MVRCTGMASMVSRSMGCQSVVAEVVCARAVVGVRANEKGELNGGDFCL